MNNKRWLILIIVLLLLIPMNYYFVPNVSATWWNTDWSYYKTVEVADKIDDYQMFLNVSYSAGGNVSCESHSQTDFDDLRFVYNNATELPYWFEKVVSSDYVWVWVNNSGNYSSFEMFYGNDAVGNNSDGDATFNFFDDFESGNLDKWTYTGDWAAAIDQKYEGTYSAKHSGVGDRDMYYTFPSAYEDRKIVELYVREHAIGTSATFIVHYPTYCVAMRNGHFQYYDGIYHNFPNDKTYVDDTWYHVLVRYNPPDSYELFVDGSSAGIVTTIEFSSIDGIGLMGCSFAERITWIDRVIFRKDATIPPSWSAFGSEQSAPFIFGAIYPPDGATDICPCGDALCIDVTASYNFNITVYSRIRGTAYWNIWNKYVNVSADEYCFCLSPSLYVPAYIYHHTNYSKAVGSAGTWYNIQFPEPHHQIKNINFTTSNNDTFRILYDGEYRMAYRISMDDSQPTPTSESYGRILINGDEAQGTLQSKGMNRQNAISSMSAHVIQYLYAGDEVQLQFTADATTITLKSHTNYGDYPSSAIFSISQLSDNELRPMQFNTTYEWYVNVSKFDNKSLYNETDVFSFTTASDYDDCITSVGGGMGADIGIVGIVGIFGLLGIFWGRWYLVKRRRNNNNNNYNYRY